MTNWPSAVAINIACVGTTLTIVYGIWKGRREAGIALQPGNELFARAAEFFRKHSKYFTSDVQLEFYALFKQATCGDAPLEGGSLMIDAWKEKRGMNISDAEAEYVSLLDHHCPKWRLLQSGGVTEDNIRDDLEASHSSGWAVGSMLADAIGDNSIQVDDSISGQLCELAANGDLAALSQMMTPQLVNVADIDGMTPLHWAADRGRVHVVQFLLASKADPNALDHSSNSPLHIAGMAGQNEIVRLLIDAKADLALVNTDGESARSILTSEFPKLFLS